MSLICATSNQPRFISLIGMENHSARCDQNKAQRGNQERSAATFKSHMAMGSLFPWTLSHINCPFLCPSHDTLDVVDCHGAGLMHVYTDTGLVPEVLCGVQTLPYNLQSTGHIVISSHAPCP